MSLRTEAVKNVTATWFGLAVQGIISFLLSPFILHRLGDEAFSIWILIFALTGYFGLLDLGIRSSIVRYTARFLARDARAELSKYLSTSLTFYGLVSVIVLCATGIAYFYLPSMFKIPVAMLGSARALLLLSGIGVALTFPLSVFTGALEGMQKFAWLQLTHLGITLLRAILIVLALENGGGLLEVGTITVVLNVISYLVFAVVAVRVLPVRLRFGVVNLSAIRTMGSYGFFATAILAAEKLRFQSDAMVIGVFLPATAITVFSIGAKLVEYASYPVKSMAQIFTPMTSEFHARDDFSRLQRVFVAGNRASALIVFPICVTLVMLGKSIITAWVGARYVSAYSVLILLIIPRSIYIAQSTSTKILLGMGLHRTLASILLLEGVANLLLSVLLARPLGVIGVALGTAIPLSMTGLLFLPHHLCGVLRMPLVTFVKRAYSLPALLCVPLGVTLWLASRQITLNSSFNVIVQAGIGGLVYGGGLALALWTQRDTHPISWQAFSQLLEPK